MRDWRQQGPVVNLPALVRAVARSDVVFGWFASWHTFWPVTLAWLMRKPSVVVIGGYDTANMPEIRYGLQGRGLMRLVSPLGDAARDAAADQLPLQPRGGGRERRGRPEPRHGRASRRARSVRRAAAGQARARWR